MKASSKHKPLERPDDSEAMREAIKWLKEHGISATRPSPPQLKVGDLSFYPDKGSINRDGCKKMDVQGLEAFSDMLTAPVAKKFIDLTS